MKNIFQMAVLVAFISLISACRTSPKQTAQHNASIEQSSVTVGITDKHWRLIELRGEPVVFDMEAGKREAFLVFNAEENRVSGNLGCNNAFGTYQIDEESNRISFSQMALTQMFCLDMSVEDGFKEILEMVDNYSVSEDGKFLSLNRARMAPLARFELILE
jgi:heat shock protein HslJ